MTPVGRLRVKKNRIRTSPIHGKVGVALSDNELDAVTDAGEESKLLHERYLAAVNNLSRKRILEALKQGSLTVEEIAAKTELSAEALHWHLSVLESVRCVETENLTGRTVYRLTQWGKVVDYLK